MEQHKSIGKLISTLHRKSHIYFQRKLEPLDLGSGQVKIFSYLAHKPGATQQELTDYFKLDKGTTSYLIKKMATGGHVRKEPDPEDRRSSKLFLTEKAIQKEKEIRKIFTGWTELLLKGFSKGERNEAFQMMERMIENVSFSDDEQV